MVLGLSFTDTVVLWDMGGVVEGCETRGMDREMKADTGEASNTPRAHLFLCQEMG